MKKEWKSKGCTTCRGMWEAGKRPPEIAINYELHSRLHQCPTCKTFWEQLERLADTVSKEQAEKYYPDAFKGQP